MSSRLSGPERRQAVVETACRVFAKSSYRGSTTAQIARETGVTEPVLYRHFASKRELYLACLDAVWERVRALWEKALEREPDPANWLRAIGKAYLEERGAARIVLVDLWIQALTEAADDPEIRRALRAQLREVHNFVADVIRRAQAAGGIVAERDPDAEAWIFISLGLLSTIDRRLGQPRRRGVRRHRRLPPRLDDRAPRQKESPRLRLRGLLVFALFGEATARRPWLCGPATTSGPSVAVSGAPLASHKPGVRLGARWTEYRRGLGASRQVARSSDFRIPQFTPFAAVI